MTGYQEVLTDPSYRDQIVAMTQPLIGNYGINAEDDGYQPHGFVIEELCQIPSNWRSKESLHDYLHRYNIPGIRRNRYANIDEAPAHARRHAVRALDGKSSIPKPPSSSTWPCVPKDYRNGLREGSSHGRLHLGR